MPHPDAGMIHAWLDGELDAAGSARIASLVERDPEWAAAAAEARGLIAASSRIVSALDVVPGNVVPSRTSAAGVTKSRFAVRPWMRIAASVTIVVGIGYVARQSLTEVATPVAQVELVADSAPAPALSPTPPPPLTQARGAGARRDAAADARTLPVPATPEPATLADVSKQAVNEPREREQSLGPPPLRSAARAPIAAAASEPATAQLSPRTVTDVEGRAELGYSAVSPTIEGCWRTRTVAPSDSVLRSPRVVARIGDTLVVALTRPETDLSPDAVRTIPQANVVRVGADLLRGTARVRDAQPVEFAATRVSCP